MVLLGVFVVLIWIMPIYALDLGKSTSNPCINPNRDQNKDNNHLDGNQDLYKQILPKNTSAGKFKDIQDLHLKILQILEGMRLRGQQNGNAYSIRYCAELESLKNSMIRC